MFDSILASIKQAKKSGKSFVMTNVNSNEDFQQLFELGYVIQNTFEKGRGNVTKISWR